MLTVVGRAARARLRRVLAARVARCTRCIQRPEEVPAERVVVRERVVAQVVVPIAEQEMLAVARVVVLPARIAVVEFVVSRMFCSAPHISCLTLSLPPV